MTQDSGAASTEPQPNQHSAPAAWMVAAMATGLTADITATTRFKFALSRLEAYVRAAAPQAERVAQAYRAAAAMLATNHIAAQELHAAALVEAHYYFITWQGARLALEALKNNGAGLRLGTPGEVWRKYKRRFESYTEARHHLEHYDERLPGGGESDWVQIDANAIGGTLPVLGSETSFCFHGKTWAVDQASADVLQRLFDELITGLRAEIRARL